MPDRESALAWLEMRRAFDAFDSPEAIEKAQREQVAAFCELFGSDELTVPSSKLSPTLERFQRYLINERRDPETGMTPAERFRKELGQELTVPDLPPLPEPVAGAGEVTILCDDFDGIVLLPDFNRFKRVFESDEPDRQVPDWRELVWTYIKNPDIPIVAFERVAEQFPLRVEKVVRTLIGDKDFSLEHLYAVLLHYKQPVDGLEDLKDDQHLWDLFNGNTPPGKSRKGQSRRSHAPKPKTAKKKSRSKPSPKQSAKKAAATSRKSAARVSNVKRKPDCKAQAREQEQTGRPARPSTAKKRSQQEHVGQKAMKLVEAITQLSRSRQTEQFNCRSLTVRAALDYQSLLLLTEFFSPDAMLTDITPSSLRDFCLTMVCGKSIWLEVDRLEVS